MRQLLLAVVCCCAAFVPGCFFIKAPIEASFSIFGALTFPLEPTAIEVDAEKLQAVYDDINKIAYAGELRGRISWADLRKIRGSKTIEGTTALLSRHIYVDVSFNRQDVLRDALYGVVIHEMGHLQTGYAVGDAHGPAFQAEVARVGKLMNVDLKYIL